MFKNLKNMSIKKRLMSIIITQAAVMLVMFFAAVAAIYLASVYYTDVLVKNGLDKALFDTVNRQRTVFIWVLLGVMIVFLPFIIIGLRFAIKSVREPIEAIRDGILKAAQGECVKVEKFGNDELGEIADAVNELTSNMEKQAQAAQRVADGDLTVNVMPRSDKDLLNIALRQLVEDNNMALTEMKNSAEQVSESSDQVAAASQTLAQGSTEQASAITEITASIEDIAQRTKVNASDADHANELVDNARNDANLGNQRMNDMIVAMTEINESSENISKIIKVIDDIAFQTNILALNAAVEAARAGSQGRGFAVVADEVRNLAGKSAQAASETAELIENSIEKVNRGSRLAEETAESLKEIVSAIEQVANITGSIAAASNEQATAVNQINQAIGQVSIVIQNNSSTSEECAAASEILSMQALKLREMIGHYTLQDTGKSKKRKSKPAAEEPRSAGYLEDKQEEKIVISLDDNFGKY